MRFRAEKNTIEKIVRQMKKNASVAADAKFCFDRPDRLRSTVSYADSDFQRYLGSSLCEEEIVTDALKFLQTNKLIPSNSSYDRSAFEKFREYISNNFIVPWSSISRVMERFLFMLASVKRPRKLIALGIYCGNSLAWSAGPSCDAAKSYGCEKVIGIDIDPEATSLARRNFSFLRSAAHIDIITADAAAYIDETREEFDYVYLDADDELLGKGLYLKLAKALYDKIVPNGWLLAHDTACASFKDQFGPYLEFVRDKRLFRESISFEIDNYGLELTIK